MGRRSQPMPFCRAIPPPQLSPLSLSPPPHPSLPFFPPPLALHGGGGARARGGAVRGAPAETPPRTLRRPGARAPREGAGRAGLGRATRRKRSNDARCARIYGPQKCAQRALPRNASPTPHARLTALTRCPTAGAACAAAGCYVPQSVVGRDLYDAEMVGMRQDRETKKDQ